MKLIVDNYFDNAWYQMDRNGIGTDATIAQHITTIQVMFWSHILCMHQLPSLFYVLFVTSI
jgi:hypothetical protein